MAKRRCSTESNSAGQITDDNRQAVETQPSSSHQEDFTTMICLLENIKDELKKMNVHLSIVTGEEI